MNKEHITACICTYKRPATLKRLMEYLAIQKTENRFSISMSIVDNDETPTAKPLVREFLSRHPMDVAYVHEPEHNLALLRNLSVGNATGDYVAFIDDDEYPSNDWLLRHYETIQHYGVSGTFGPVLPKFRREPPKWVARGRLYERARHKTGFRLKGRNTRTGNALIRRSVFSDPGNLFDLKFRLGGEDDTFFGRMIDKGYEFAWCDEALVYEEIPPERLQRDYFVNRARLTGYMSYHYFKDERPWQKNAFAVLLSLQKAAIYLFLLPFSRFFGRHCTVKLRIGLNHNLAVIKTALGILKIDRRDL